MPGFRPVLHPCLTHVNLKHYGAEERLCSDIRYAYANCSTCHFGKFSKIDIVCFKFSFANPGTLILNSPPSFTTFNQ
jgi:hypothetical protein